MNALAPMMADDAPLIHVKKPFKLTDKQLEANIIMGGPEPNKLLRGGSRSGKTFLFCRRIAVRALRASGSRHAIWRFHYNHAKNSIGKDTFPKMMGLVFPQIVERMGGCVFSHEGVLTLPNQSEIWLGGLDDKERVEKILGTEFATNYFNECSQFPFHSIEIAKSRLAQMCVIDMKGDPRFGEILPLENLYDMNPPGKRHWTYDVWKRHVQPGTRDPIPYPDDYIEMQINPDDNRENLPPAYFKTLEGMSAAKRKRFKEGEWANDAEGVLWNDSMLDRCRLGTLPDDVRLTRVVIGVDPSGSKGDKFAEEVKANDIGIVVAGLGSDNKGYVLEDATVNASPGEWGQVVAQMGRKWNADRVIAEPNYGGAMVEFVLKTADPTMPVKMVPSSRGKALRAEPIAALYEPNQEKVKHVGFFGELEDQMTSMMPQPNGYQGEGSPDRLDAAVFALTELMLGSGYNLENLD